MNNMIEIAEILCVIIIVSLSLRGFIDKPEKSDEEVVNHLSELAMRGQSPSERKYANETLRKYLLKGFEEESI